MIIMNKDPDIINVIADEEEYRNAFGLALDFLLSVLKDTPPKTIKLSAAVCAVLIVLSAAAGYLIPKSDSSVSRRIEKLHTAEHEYVLAKEDNQAAADKVISLAKELEEKKQENEDIAFSRDNADKTAAENSSLTQQKQQLLSDINAKKAQLADIEASLGSAGKSVLTFEECTVTVGEQLAAGEYSVAGSGNIVISANGKARVNEELGDGKAYTVKSGEVIRIKGRAVFTPAQ